MEDGNGTPRAVLDILKIRENSTIARVRSRIQKEAANYPSSTFQSLHEPFYIPDLIEMETQALESCDVEDVVAVWSIPLYAQRKYWFKLFIGFNYGIFAVFLTNWTMAGIPDPTYSEPIVRLYEYLGNNAGLQTMEEVLGDPEPLPRPRYLETQRSAETLPVTHRVVGSIKSSSSMKSLKARISWDSFSLGYRRSSNDNTLAISPEKKKQELTDYYRQSKLSQEQLSELQRSTHFDKKELQQWYKGIL